jgi:hypothetical protein
VDRQDGADARTHLRHERLHDSVKLGALIGKGPPAAAVNAFTAAAQRCKHTTRYTADERGRRTGCCACEVLDGVWGNVAREFDLLVLRLSKSKSCRNGERVPRCARRKGQVPAPARWLSATTGALVFASVIVQSPPPPPLPQPQQQQS